MKSITKLMLACAAAASLAVPVLPLSAQAAAPAVSVNGDIKAEKTVTAPDTSPTDRAAYPSEAGATEPTNSP